MQTNNNNDNGYKKIRKVPEIINDLKKFVGHRNLDVNLLEIIENCISEYKDVVSETVIRKLSEGRSGKYRSHIELKFSGSYPQLFIDKLIKNFVFLYSVISGYDENDLNNLLVFNIVFNKILENGFMCNNNGEIQLKFIPFTYELIKYRLLNDNNLDNYIHIASNHPNAGHENEVENVLNKIVSNKDKIKNELFEYRHGEGQEALDKTLCNVAGIIGLNEVFYNKEPIPKTEKHNRSKSMDSIYER